MSLVIGALAEAGAYCTFKVSFLSDFFGALTTFQLGNLTINPYEVTVGQPVNITVGAVNVGDIEGSYSLSLNINGSAETKS